MIDDLQLDREKIRIPGASAVNLSRKVKFHNRLLASAIPRHSSMIA
jgi:hypothetical protein